MLENYGSWRGIKNRIAEEPVETALDFATLGVGGTVLKGLKGRKKQTEEPPQAERQPEAPKAPPSRQQYEADLAELERLEKILDSSGPLGEGPKGGLGINVEIDKSGKYKITPRGKFNIFQICLLYTSPSPRDS